MPALVMPTLAGGAQKEQQPLREPTETPWARFQFRLPGVHAGLDAQQAGVHAGPGPRAQAYTGLEIGAWTSHTEVVVSLENR